MGVAYDLSGRGVLVVGGSSGVGREIGPAASRADVAFAARRLDRLETAADDAEGVSVAVPCDVTDDADCARAVTVRG